MRSAQGRARRVVNTHLLQLYRTIGHTIVERQATEERTGVADRISDDLRRRFPDLKGLGRSNIHSMR